MQNGAEEKGGMLYGPLIRDMVWSYSRIKAFEACPYRWFLNYIEHRRETDQFYVYLRNFWIFYSILYLNIFH